MKEIKIDICIIGAGSGGLSVAAGAAQLGLRTVLIENHKMGGDCLNAGCVPSKALLAAAKRAMTARQDNIMGIAPSEPKIDFAAVKKHVAGVIKTIEPNDSVERFTKLGVRVITATGEFIGKNKIQAGDNIITARYVVIATGSRAIVPAIAGLDKIDKAKVFTNETIFQLKEKPDHLLIIGGGPIGMEMAQAHVRLGCRVSVIDHGQVMPRDDQAAVAIIKQHLTKEGVAFHEQAQIKEITASGKNITIAITNGKGKSEKINGTHLLVAAGRQSNIQSLNLDRAGIKHNGRSIMVDKRLRTNHKNIYAIGDCNGGPQFTHAAGYQAGIIIRQVCFKMPASVDYAALPWVTYTDPELAQVGLNEAAAIAKYGKKCKIATWPFHDNDRAVAEGETAGFAKIIADKKGRIVGGTIVGPHAGDMILTIGLAINKKCTIGDLAGVIAPYPSRGEIIKRAAGSYYTPILFSDKTRRVVKLLQWLP
ncbi:MAG: FAD-dependent oxidoreductase [Hydrotalea sp.]|nr:FAD-dependent oxidoreductase [Hydrotalea sp.]